VADGGVIDHGAGSYRRAPPAIEATSFVGEERSIAARAEPSGESGGRETVVPVRRRRTSERR
jgi:hypothetical protein